MKYKIIAFGFILLLLGTYTYIQVSSANSKKLNLVALGDSITHGTGDPSGQGYIERVKKKFEDKMGVVIQLNNYAIPKYTTENILKQLHDQKILNDVQKATYLVLYVGTNDFRKSADHRLNPLNSKQLHSGRHIFSKNLHQILTTLRRENPTAPIFILGLFHPYVEYPNQQEILHEINQWNTEIKNVIAVYERTFYVTTLDLFTDKPKMHYFSDSLHPNPSGYQKMANRLYMNIERDFQSNIE